MTDYDIEDQQEEEQFTEELDAGPSKEALKRIKAQKKFEELQEKRLKVQKARLDKLNKIRMTSKTEKEKAVFTRINNQNHYICHDCGQPFKEDEISLIYGSYGERAYCRECVTKRFPNYRPIKLLGTQSKLDFMSNHADTAYSKGFK